MDLDFIESTDASSSSDLEQTRAKTSLRMYYEAQVEVIRKQTGSLEEVRAKLGLSGRKMAQLLMVDPSAWTRWTKNGDTIPPHIWRALQWYMTIQEKIPGLTPQYFIGRQSGVSDPAVARKVEELNQTIVSTNQDLEEMNSQLEKRIQDLEAAIRVNRATAIVMGLATLIMAFAFYRMMKS